MSDLITELEQMDIQLQLYEQQCNQAKTTLDNMSKDANHKLGDLIAQADGKPHEIKQLCNTNKALAVQCQQLIDQLKDVLVIKDVTDTYLKEIEDLFTSKGFNDMFATTQSLKVLKKGKFQDKTKDTIIKDIEFAGGVASVAIVFKLLFKFGTKVRTFITKYQNGTSSAADAADLPQQIEIKSIDSFDSFDSFDNEVSVSAESDSVAILSESSEELESMVDMASVGSEIEVAAEASASTASQVGNAVSSLVNIIGILGAIAFIAGIVWDGIEDKKTYKKLINQEKQNTKDLTDLCSMLQELINSLKTYYSTILKGFFDNAMLDENDPNYERYNDPTSLSLEILATAVNDELNKQQITQQKATSWVTTFESSLMAMIAFNPKYGKGFDPSKVSIDDIKYCVNLSVDSLGYTDKTESEMAANTMKIYWVLTYNIDNDTAIQLIGNGITSSHLATMKSAFLASQGESTKDISQQTGINTTQRSKL